MRLMPWGYLLSLAVGMALVGCSTDGCLNNRNSIPMAGFYDYETRDPLTLSGLGVSGVGAPNDSLILSPSSNAHQVYLPFRGTLSEVAYIFSYNDSEDVVTFHYDSYPYFDGDECGAMWRYRIRSVEWSGELIDSVSVVDSLITNIERERIMFFITVPESETESEQ